MEGQALEALDGLGGHLDISIPMTAQGALRRPERLHIARQVRQRHKQPWRHVGHALLLVLGLPHQDCPGLEIDIGPLQPASF